MSAGESPRLYQSLTLIGESVKANTLNSVSSITISVDFPDSANGFDSDFFNFPATSQTIDVPTIGGSPDDYQNVVVELYLSEVSVGFGL